MRGASGFGGTDSGILNIKDIFLSVASACLFTEFAGYWFHILLHSDKIEFLSRSHMIHHLVVYGPNKPMRPSREYLDSTYGRANVLGIGMEWLFPAGLILSGVLLVFRALGIPAACRIAFVTVSLAWGYLMFGYMHDAMHLQAFWMERSRFLRRWFLGARKLHDIHHMPLDDAGKMPTNFGICFFVFDRLFGTLVQENARFDQQGLEAALKRYAYIFADH